MKHHSDFSGSKLLKGSLRFHFTAPLVVFAGILGACSVPITFITGTNINEIPEHMPLIPSLMYPIAGIIAGALLTFHALKWMSRDLSHSRFFCRGFNDRSSAKRIIIFSIKNASKLFNPWKFGNVCIVPGRNCFHTCRNTYRPIGSKTKKNSFRLLTLGNHNCFRNPNRYPSILGRSRFSL